MPPPTQPAAPQGPITVIQIDAQLGELAVFVSGREPKIWWPPEVGGWGLVLQGCGLGWQGGGGLGLAVHGCELGWQSSLGIAHAECTRTVAAVMH